MLEPLVSVLVPLYNHETYIEACLSSLLNESYPNLELILLDDGSKDRSFAVATAWIQANQGRFTRVKAWSQPNAGICRTLNRLVQEAHGAFLTVVASDDALLKGGIHARVRFLEQHRDLLAVIGDAEAMDGSGGRLAASTIRDFHHGSKPALANPKTITRELILNWSVPGPVFLARSATWDPTLGIGRYDETLSVEDRDFYLRLLARKALGFIDVPVAQYRIHSSNASISSPANSGVNSLKHQIMCDFKRCQISNLQRFKGLDKAVFYLVIKHNEYENPRKSLRYKWAGKLIKLFRSMNRMGLLGK